MRGKAMSKSPVICLTLTLLAAQTVGAQKLPPAHRDPVALTPRYLQETHQAKSYGGFYHHTSPAKVHHPKFDSRVKPWTDHYFRYTQKGPYHSMYRINSGGSPVNQHLRPSDPYLPFDINNPVGPELPQADPRRSLGYEQGYYRKFYNPTPARRK